MASPRCCPPKSVTRADFTGDATIFRALSDQHRLTILASLAQTGSEICVCDFTNNLPLNQPTVSHHLRVLRESGLIVGTRRGTWMYYRLADGAKRRLQHALQFIFEGKAAA